MQTSEQAAAPPAADSQAIQDRIGAWFSSPSNEPQKPVEKQAPAPQQEAPEATDQVPETTEATSEEAPAESTAPTFEEVEYEGKTYQVPPELKEAIIRQSDYTKKSQTLAEQRRTIELQQHQARIAQLSEQFNRETAQEMQELSMLDTVIKQARQTDWSQLPLEDLIRKRADIDNLAERHKALSEKIEGKRREWGEKQQAEIAKLRAQSLETISKRVPGWNEATAKSIREHALSEGYTETELNSILDPRHVLTLWKAQQYDQTRKNAAPAVSQAKAAKVSSANPMPAHVKDTLNFRKAVARTEGKPTERKALVEQRIQNLFRKR